MFKVWKCTAPTSPQAILRENGIELESIDTVVFSHTHLWITFTPFDRYETIADLFEIQSDHVGDIRDLTPHTTLQFGPYEDRTKIDDKQKLASSLFVQLEDVKERKIEHLSDADWKIYGNLKGVDFFEDGSLILLDTPGVSQITPLSLIRSLMLLFMIIV